MTEESSFYILPISSGATQSSVQWTPEALSLQADCSGR